MEPKRVLLLNSGGPDSACLAKILRRDFPEASITSLWIDFGAMNAEATKAASAHTAKLWCDDHKTVPIDFGFFSNASLKDDRAHKPQAPFITEMTLSIGLSYGSHLEADFVAAAFKGDIIRVPGYENVANWFFHVISNGYHRPDLLLPFASSKYQTYPSVMERADLTPADLRYTVSCEQKTPCGICGKCVDRRGNKIDED